MRLSQLLRFTAPTLLWVGAAALPRADVHAQAVIDGRVIDERNAPIAGASIVAEPGGSGQVTRSADDGTFRITVGGPGRFQLRVQRVGFRPAIVREVEVRGGRAASVTIVLAPAVMGLAPVVITARPLDIDAERTDATITLDAARIAMLPQTREAEEMLRIMPGARHGQLWGGMTTQANLYQVDGVPMTHPGLGGNVIALLPSWLSSFEVTGLGSGAEFGDFQGGVVSQVIRTGTEQRRGRAMLYLESRHLNGSNLRATDLATEPAERREAVVEASGPVRSGQLYYFGGAQLVQRTTRSLDHLVALADPPSRYANAWEARFAGKLSALPGPNSIAHVAAGFGTIRESREGLVGFETIDATRERTAPMFFFTMGGERRSGDEGVLEARIGGFTGDERRTPAQGDAVPAIRSYELLSERTFQNAVFSERYRPRAMSGTIRLRARRSHDGRLEGGYVTGVDGMLGDWRELRTRAGGMTWRPVKSRNSTPALDPRDPATWTSQGVIRAEWGDEVDLGASVGSVAWFTQLFLRYRRLTILPGARESFWSSSVRAGGEGVRVRAAQDRASDRRIGLIADLTGTNRLVVKGHWGRFHQGMFAQLFERVSAADAFSDDELWIYSGASFSDPRTTFSTADRDALAATGQFRRFATLRRNERADLGTYRQPYTDQLMGSVEALLGSSWKTRVMFLDRQSRDIVSLRDRNLASNYSRYTNVAIRDRFGGFVFDQHGDTLVLAELWVPNDAIRMVLEDQMAGIPTGHVPGFTFADHDRLTFAPDLTLGVVPGARRRFRQTQLVIDGNFVRWSMTASAVWSRAVGNVTGVAGTEDTLRMSPGPFVRPNESIGADGRIERIAPFEAKLLLTARLPARLSGGIFWSFAQGERFAPTFTLNHGVFRYSVRDSVLDDRLISASNGQRLFLEARGSRQYDYSHQLDLHVERAFGGPARRLVVSVDAINALGAGTVTSINTAVDAQSNPDALTRFGATRGRLAPRALRLGVGLQW